MNRYYGLLTGLLSCLVAACDSIKTSPQMIIADGETYFGCQNFVWSSNESGWLAGTPTFKLSFTDAAGLDHVIKGIRKLSVSDLPHLIPAPMPYPLPDPNSSTDRSGDPYKEGNVYTWADGSTAVRTNGQWKAVMRANPACKLE
jgi:hypothetical protein